MLLTRRQAMVAIFSTFAAGGPAVAQRRGAATNLKVVTLAVSGMT
jgi:hypothetical protein